MRTRSQELRERHRRIFMWSMMAAVAVHVGVFVLAPTFRAEPLPGADLAPDTTGVLALANASVQVLFGPPTVTESDGSRWTASSDRVLPAQRDLRLEDDCLAWAERGRIPARGSVRLRVKASGRVEVLGLADSTGDLCADRVVTSVAEALWYHWLPNQRFPAPVEVVQPVTLISATSV